MIRSVVGRERIMYAVATIFKAKFLSEIFF